MSIRTCLIGAASLGPYHRARFNALARAGIELTVVQTPIREKYRPWSVDLDDVSFQVEQPFQEAEHLRWPELIKLTDTYLKEKCPQAVICVGYNRKYVWAVSYCCRQMGIPVVVLLVGWAGERSRIFWKEWAKRLFCKRFFSAAVVTGSRAAEYARKLGLGSSYIWTAGNVVDNEHFSQARGRLVPAEFSNVPPHFLTIARLSAEKNLSTLLAAFVRYRDRGGTWHLRIVGAGPEEERLKGQVPEAYRDLVQWAGWKQYQELPAIYASASCFVLPSLIEPWGLVVNEAMAAGLPVLVSRQCGCVPELCRRGVNGYDFDPLNAQELSDLMLRISSDQVDLETMGKASSVIVAAYSLDYWSKTVLDCLRQVSSPKGKF